MADPLLSNTKPSQPRSHRPSHIMKRKCEDGGGGKPGLAQRTIASFFPRLSVEQQPHGNSVKEPQKPEPTPDPPPAPLDQKQLDRGQRAQAAVRISVGLYVRGSQRDRGADFI